MLVAIMVMNVLMMLFLMAAVGHLGKIEKLLSVLTQSKLEELKLWHGK